MGDCERCKGTGDLGLNRHDRQWDICPYCGGSGTRPWTEVDGIEFARRIDELAGERIKQVQVREESVVDIPGRGYGRYQVIIETEEGSVVSIDGDHDSGPDITILKEVPPIKKDRDW